MIETVAMAMPISSAVAAPVSQWWRFSWCSLSYISLLRSSSSPLAFSSTLDSSAAFLACCAL
ncbi:hypothetical protein BH09PSE2_BH09PSE2_07940 [soil metagenome]